MLIAWRVSMHPKNISLCQGKGNTSEPRNFPTFQLKQHIELNGTNQSIVDSMRRNGQEMENTKNDNIDRLFG
jgi:hypothetical protein